jgi:hypothetical protein
VVKLYSKWYKLLGDNWPKFVARVRRQAESDDKNFIQLTEFMRVCMEFKIDVKDEERQNIVFSFPGRDDGTSICVNIYPLYD